MNKRPSEALKAAAAGVVEWIHAGRPDTVAPEAFMREWEPGGRREATPPSEKMPGEPQKGSSIGIWKRVLSPRGLVYERDVKVKRYWHQWANVARLQPKGDKRRVIMLGESVARAFFYDPHYTVASQLDDVLRSIKGMPAMQVTDLAKTNCSMDELLQLARSCRALEPDAVVIFAGNNWHSDLYDALTKEDRRQMLADAGAGDLGAVKDFMEKKMSGLIRTFFETLETVLPLREIPVIFLIPGYNLRDWKNAHARRSLPWLPGAAVRTWLEFKTAAEAALIKNDGEGVSKAARAMIGLDPYHPYGYELLAQYHSWCGDWEAAKANLRLYRDSGLIHRGDNINPACFGVVRETILAEAKRYEIAAVDCQELYENHKGEGIPGRDYFLDYCHLTAEAIRVTMQATARLLARKFKGIELAADTAPVPATGPDKEVQAIAHFSAAIHNAHRDQPAEIIEYHCRKALSYSGTVAELMLPFIDLSTRRASSNLCGAFERIILTGKMQQYDGGFALQHPAGMKLMDIKLVDAIVTALEHSGHPAGARTARLRMLEHGVDAQGVDLLDSFYSRSSYNTFPGELSGPAYLQARSTTSTFSFVAHGGNALHLELVYRTPGNPTAEDDIRMVVNGRADRSIPLCATRKWTAVDFRIEKDLLISGVNRLTIAWPYRGMEVKGRDRESSSGDLPGILCPVLGEIHSLTAVEKSTL